MKQLTFYKIVIIALVLTNVVSLFFLRTSNRRPEFGPKHRKSLVEILEIKGANIDKVKQLEKEHFKLKDSIIDHNRALHEQLLTSFDAKNMSNTQTSAIVNNIVENQREAVQMTYNYFKKINKPNG